MDIYLQYKKQKVYVDARLAKGEMGLGPGRRRPTGDGLEGWFGFWWPSWARGQELIGRSSHWWTSGVSLDCSGAAGRGSMVERMKWGSCT